MHVALMVRLDGTATACNNMVVAHWFVVSDTGAPVNVFIITFRPPPLPAASSFFFLIPGFFVQVLP